MANPVILGPKIKVTEPEDRDEKKKDNKSGSQTMKRIMGEE